MPEHLLLPWLPSLILRLRPHRDILQTLLKEAVQTFHQPVRPGGLAASLAGRTSPACRGGRSDR